MTPLEEEACRQALIWRERHERLRDALYDLLAEEPPAFKELPLPHPHPQ